MMKSIVTLAYFFFCIVVFRQTSSNTKEPCTDAIAQTTKGKWIKRYDNASNITPAQKQEAYKRLDIVHNTLLKMYPDPTGVDVRESRGAGIAYFGSTRKYRYTEDGELAFDYVKLLPIKAYSYYANFSPHFCAHTDKGIIFQPGVMNENSDGPRVAINDFAGLAGSPASDDDWTLNGLPVNTLATKTSENWKGYEVYGDIRDRVRTILLHREGMLPYIPVTRKQYLERCIAVTTKLHNNIIDFQKQMPVRSPEEEEAEKKAKLEKFEKDFGKDPKRLKSAVDYYLSGYKSDQQIRDEEVEKAIKIRDAELKKFNDELEKSTKEGLLDSPAFIRVRYNPDMIFDTNHQTGSMLVTDNPDYIRKDLPAHVPQFIVFTWKWHDDYPPHAKYKRLLLEEFPIEKLQAMIDK